MTTVGPLLVLQFEDAAPPARLGDWLAEAGLSLDVRRADLGAAPESLDGFAALVVLGGAISSYDDARQPWLAGVKALLRAAVAAQLPTLGVCLGGQLLALANGGRVQLGPQGPELGAQLVAKRSSAAADPLFRELPIAPDVLQWHWDAITSLPPGAIQLASSPVCENQAFRLGRLAWGLQFHIETTPAVVRTWAAADAAALEGYDVRRILERSDAAHDDIAETWQPFVVAFAEIVRDPDSVPDVRAIPSSQPEPSPGGHAPTAGGTPITDPAAIRAALAAEAMHSHASNVIPLQTRRPDDA